MLYIIQRVLNHTCFASNLSNLLFHFRLDVGSLGDIKGNTPPRLIRMPMLTQWGEVVWYYSNPKRLVTLMNETRRKPCARAIAATQPDNGSGMLLQCGKPEYSSSLVFSFSWLKIEAEISKGQLFQSCCNKSAQYVSEITQLVSRRSPFNSLQDCHKACKLHQLIFFPPEELA